MASFVKTGFLAASLASIALPGYGENTGGQNGELHFYGSLLEGACRLDMRSDFQEVKMPAIPLAALQKTGDSGPSSTFVLRLRACQRSGGKITDLTRGIVTWDAIQPVITVSFTGVLDPDNPSLLMMKGIRGAGLLIRDSSGHQIYPGERGRPQFVSPGDDQLIYTVTPVRTQAPLIAGEFRTVLDFKVNYD
ncbi:fimbrial protein [Citrobacter amalonaticus]|uniref:fimbrial protein n=1 Tax=Citrobacter amalonaticus TaxID=35703 RepID=UPI00300DB0FF